MKTCTYRQLGKSDLYLSPIGLGSWQFSGSGGIGSRFWKPLSQQETDDIIHASVMGGINWVDTAEAYGNGNSERAVSNALEMLHSKAPDSPPVYIADKWWPLGRRASSLTKTIAQRRACLGNRIIDLYQIHHPTSISSLSSQMAEMKRLVENGDIRYVGVSNFSGSQMYKVHELLSREGLLLVSNQVQYNLFDRSIERNGVLDAAKELGVSIIAYSPLHQGLLTGKFHENPEMLKQLFWLRKAQYKLNNKTLKRTKPLMDTMKKISVKYDCQPAQIALNWILHSQGETVFAIPGASNLRHVKANISTMNFELSTEELSTLSELS